MSPSLWRALVLAALALLPPTQVGAQANLLELARRCQARAERIRGLHARRPIRWQVASRRQIRAYLDKVLAQQYRPGELEAEAKTYRALGLVPEDLDYDDFLLELLEEQIGGVYDPVAEIFYLADWIPAQFQESIIIHEVTHALQDQAFGIDHFLERLRGNSDAMLARSALVEGEATAVMLSDALKQAGTPVTLENLEAAGNGAALLETLSAVTFPTFSRAPSSLRRLLLFPYLAGLRFVAAAKRHGGWEIINRIYRDLPASSEQILHPEKYFNQRDAPTPIIWPELIGLVDSGWQPVNNDVLGEFGVRLLLGDLDEDEQHRAAAGWDGDRVWVFEKGRSLAWVMLSVWDSAADAIQFAGALARTVPRRHPRARAEPIGPRPRMVWRLDDGRVVWIERGQQRVAVTFALERTAAERISSGYFQLKIPSEPRRQGGEGGALREQVKK